MAKRKKDDKGITADWDEITDVHMLEIPEWADTTDSDNTISAISYTQPAMVSMKKYDELKELVGDIIKCMNTPTKCYGKLADLEKKFGRL